MQRTSSPIVQYARASPHRHPSVLPCPAYSWSRSTCIHASSIHSLFPRLLVCSSQPSDLCKHQLVCTHRPKGQVCLGTTRMHLPHWASTSRTTSPRPPSCVSPSRSRTINLFSSVQALPVRRWVEQEMYASPPCWLHLIPSQRSSMAALISTICADRACFDAADGCCRCAQGERS